MKTIRTATSELREALENENFHTDALIVECVEKCRYDLIIELSKLAQAHEKQGSITLEQIALRDRISGCLLDNTPLR